MTSTERNVDASLHERIDRMHARDRTGLVAFVIVLWCTMLFALFTIWPFIGEPAIRAILASRLLHGLITDETTACQLLAEGAADKKAAKNNGSSA